MSDPDLDHEPDPELDSRLADLGWRTYEEAFGDRADLARAAARRIGQHENRAHTRGTLLSPSLIDLIRRELVHDARPPLVAGERSFVGKPVLDAQGQQVGEVVAEEREPDGSTLTIRLGWPPPDKTLTVETISIKHEYTWADLEAQAAGPNLYDRKLAELNDALRRNGGR